MDKEGKRIERWEPPLFFPLFALAAPLLKRSSPLEKRPSGREAREW